MVNTHKNIVCGPKEKGTLPLKSFGHIFFNTFKSKDPNSTLLYCNDGIDKISTGKFLSTTILIAKKLQAMGIKKNDVVSLISYNSWEYLAIVVACFYVGATTNTLNELYSINEFTHFCNICQPKLIFCSAAAWPNLKTYLDQNPKTNVIFVDKSVDNAHFCLNSLVDSENENFDDFQPVDLLDPSENISMIFMSSGTTGLPKAVMLTQANMRNTFSYTCQEKYMYMGSKTSSVNFLPFCHIYGMVLSLSLILYGGQLVLMKQFNGLKFLMLVEKFKANTIFGVTPIVAFLVTSPLVEKYDLTSVKKLISGGMPMPKFLHEAFKARFPSTIHQLCYGLTETTLAATVGPFDNFLTVGFATPNTEIVVCDKNGIFLGPNEIGEIRFKGAGIMKGYLNNEEATKATFDENGFLKSGDLGYYDKNESFYIVGRLKEIIKYKGFQVSPVELESLIMQLDGVDDVGVVGMPDEVAGELPVALVVKNSASNISENDILNYVKNNISPQKRLHGGVRFVESIPKNVLGKIVRKKLAELLISKDI